MMKYLYIAAAAFIATSFTAGGPEKCKVKPIVKTLMPKMEAPYQYDSYVVKEIVYGPKAKKEVLDFQVFSDEEYKLVFGQTVLPQEVGITIYDMFKGKKRIIYFDESGKKSAPSFNFQATKTGTYYIEYEIPAQTAAGQSGCFVLLIGVKDN